jgi:hypothetical protein
MPASFIKARGQCQWLVAFFRARSAAQRRRRDSLRLFEALVLGQVIYCRFMDPNTTVKLISGVLALALVGVIILRRKKKKGAEEDDF